MKLWDDVYASYRNRYNVEKNTKSGSGKVSTASLNEIIKDDLYYKLQFLETSMFDFSTVASSMKPKNVSIWKGVKKASTKESKTPALDKFAEVKINDRTNMLKIFSSLASKVEGMTEAVGKKYEEKTVFQDSSKEHYRKLIESQFQQVNPENRQKFMDVMLEIIDNYSNCKSMFIHCKSSLIIVKKNYI